jgi:BCD family chlorophyll transporter-like MFS transporter
MIGWAGILRLGMVQAALGAIVVLVTSTMNRVMVVELGLPALLPGALVALHYGIQILRPRIGHGADAGGRKTPFIVGGMAVLALGGLGAALSVAAMATHPVAGAAGAVVAFAMVGVGVGASGTSLLVLLSARVAPRRRAAAATIVWTMMIFGIAVTATVAGRQLAPFSTSRLVVVTAAVCACAMALTLLAVWGVEGAASAAAPARRAEKFMPALREVWTDPRARTFSIFVFVSMLAYSAQELVIEPFAGLVFQLQPGESTGLVGVQHAGVLVGMIFVAVAGGAFGGRRDVLRAFTIGGCVCSAAAILALAAGGAVGPGWPLKPTVFALGAANGAFAVSAIGAMMGLAHEGGASRAGVRMGLWGAAQAVAFGLGGLLGSAASDAARAAFGSPVHAYGAVFAVEAALFLAAAVLAARVFQPETGRVTAGAMPGAILQGGD